MATFVVFIVERPENNILVIFYAEMGVIVMKKIKREVPHTVLMLIQKDA